MEIQQKPQSDLVRIVLALAAIFLLLVGSLVVLSPFAPAFLWATMVVVSTWPIMKWLERRLGGRRSWAIALIVGGTLLAVLLPLWFAVSAAVEQLRALRDRSPEFVALLNAPPPPWVTAIPLVGKRIAAEWLHLSEGGSAGLAARVAPLARNALQWLAEQLGTLGSVAVHFFVTLVLSAVLYAQGEKAAEWATRLARRLGGNRGEGAVVQAGTAIRAVALGIVVTALVQSLLGGLGLLICRVPAAGILTAIMFMLCLMQVGPVLVLLPAVVWLFWTGQFGYGVTLAVVSLVVLTLDNALRPFLIQRGADLPLLLILVGVIGGLLSFGFVGLFVGPALLAVTYRLMESWVLDGEAPDSLK